MPRNANALAEHYLTFSENLAETLWAEHDALVLECPNEPLVWAQAWERAQLAEGLASDMHRLAAVAAHSNPVLTPS